VGTVFPSSQPSFPSRVGVTLHGAVVFMARFFLCWINVHHLPCNPSTWEAEAEEALF
jgi:hypothetical protein